MQNRDPFILVLIDGNGMIFQHNFLKQGELGGKTAANTVNNAIFEWARNNITEVPEETKVVVRVYANVKGIAEACAKAGIVEHPSRVEEFVRGFTSSNPLSDIIDVGAASDAVEGKIDGESATIALSPSLLLNSGRIAEALSLQLLLSPHSLRRQPQ
jgi:hypothetical protein